MLGCRFCCMAQSSLEPYQCLLESLSPLRARFLIGLGQAPQISRLLTQNLQNLPVDDEPLAALLQVREVEVVRNAHQLDK